MLRIVYNFAETLKIGKQQVCTLVSSKTTAESDNQCIWIETLEQLNYTCRIALILQPCLTELLLNIVEQLRLQSLACSPDFLIRTVIDTMPDFLVALVAHMLCIKVLSINITPLCSTPCWEVNTVGNVAHVILLRIVAFPDWSKHLLRYPTMKHRYTINLLTSVTSKCTHTELLAMIIRIGTAHANELIP